MQTALQSPTGVWWKPAHKAERIWVRIAFAWCMVLFAMMPLWHWKGGQNPAGVRGRVEPSAFATRAREFIEAYKVGEQNGFAVVEPPPGADIYLIAQMWQWEPVLRLRKGVEYTLHLSSLDVNHGFSLTPVNLNFQVVPGYDYALKITPTTAGEFAIVCNEFCGIQHHAMVGRVIVLENDGSATPGGAP